MPSFSRNTRANSLLRPQTLGAVLALTLASGAALADGAHRFVFTAYSDADGGAAVMSGRYRAALEELKGHRGTMEVDSSATNTNRCVAYSMTMQWKEAHAACDAAVRAAREQLDDDYLALAYANRAVMYWLSQDDAAAQKDLMKAQCLSPRADFVVQDLAALKVHRTLALASAPAPRS
ncbi:MAG TPA: hypothetical protein VIC29_04275 [Steroidobacteraceae bacterium]|jgi:hypothetical protein